MIDLSLLSTFFVFVDSPNITEAAKSLGLSQPAVTGQLRAFEAQIGASLFTFKGKKKVLTPLGQRLHKDLRKEFHHLYTKFEQFTKSAQNPEDIEMRVSGRRELIHSFIDRMDFPFKQTYTESSSKEAVEMLNNGEADIALSSIKSSDPAHKNLVFIQDHAHFLIHKKWLKNTKASLSLFKDEAFISSIPFISYKRPAPHIEKWCAKNRISMENLDYRISVDNWEKVCELIELKKGWTLCPSTFKPTSKDVLTFPIPKNHLTLDPIYMVYPKYLDKLLGINNFL